MIDLVVQSETKLALEQWLAARGLGRLEQIPSGEWIYTHTAPGTFGWWRHPSGLLEQAVDRTDPENHVTTYFGGFWGMLRFEDSIPIEGWVRASTAAISLYGFPAYGGEGIAIVTPEKIEEHLASIGVPSTEWAGGNQNSDPRVWWASPVMTGTQRVIDGVTYESTIDFNHWSPSEYPGGWTEVQVTIGVWAIGTVYSVGDEVTYEGVTYRCLQAHTSLLGWHPPAVPALWSPV